MLQISFYSFLLISLSYNVVVSLSHYVMCNFSMTINSIICASLLSKRLLCYLGAAQCSSDGCQWRHRPASVSAAEELSPRDPPLSLRHRPHSRRRCRSLAHWEQSPGPGICWGWPTWGQGVACLSIFRSIRLYEINQEK